MSNFNDFAQTCFFICLVSVSSPSRHSKQSTDWVKRSCMNRRSVTAMVAHSPVTSPAKTKNPPGCLLISRQPHYTANCVVVRLLVQVRSVPRAPRILWRRARVFAALELAHLARLMLIRKPTRDTLFICYTIEIIVCYRNVWFDVLFMLLCHQQQQQQCLESGLLLKCSRTVRGCCDECDQF